MSGGKKGIKILGYVGLGILAFLAVICISVFVQTIVAPDKIPSIFGFKPFIVLSGSMETEIYEGDLAVTQVVDVNTLEEGDIIAFRDNSDHDHVVTHRIVEVVEDESGRKFVTKGDNNNANDQGVVRSEDVEGKYLYKIDGLGEFLLILQKPMTLCIVLVIIAVIGALWIIVGRNKLSNDERKELEKLRREKNKKGGQIEEDASGGDDGVK